MILNRPFRVWKQVVGDWTAATRPLLRSNGLHGDFNKHRPSRTSWNCRLARKLPERRFKSSFAAPAAYDQLVESFPSIVIGRDGAVLPHGVFAEAQAQYLDPDLDAVEILRDSLLRAKMGVVAHYYMDVELQGVLHAVKHSHPGLEERVAIADSLKMGDLAVQMCRDHGVEAIACLGVDFMAESCAAILEKNGFGHIPVYRASDKAIGCSLAESAERESYRAWLQYQSKEAAAQNQMPLHVVYINTSLETKAISASLVPTITCTSSNVLHTILQASAQMGSESLQVLYGPDTYMGNNLRTLLDTVLANSKQWDDNRIKAQLHPLHSRETLRQLRQNLKVYPNGTCVVHHMFGQQVVDTVKRDYDDCFVTAHLEVPGEMFEIAMQKSLLEQGVVGSTSDILNFITKKVIETANRNPMGYHRLKFVLGTEAGMVTSIVRSVQDILQQASNQDIEVEVIFPVSSDAIMSSEDDSLDGISVVPGVSGGEGCSTAGGCATCPFMKMNDLDALQDIVNRVERVQQGRSSFGMDPSSDEVQLRAHLPPQRLRGRYINGTPATDLGTQPILYMRELMRNNQLPDGLVHELREHTP